ncbi:9635_t:CDS:2, partial [Funneliformis caledonium]
ESELDDELGFNLWSDHYSPIQFEEDTDDNGELEELIEDNPAAYLAEVAGYTTKIDPTIKEDIEWHISSPKSEESEEWFEEELSQQYSNT